MGFGFFSPGEKIPEPTFYVGTNKYVNISERLLSVEFNIIWDEEKKKFKCEPESIPLRDIIPGAKSDKRRYIIRKICMDGFLNRSNFTTQIEFFIVPEGSKV